MKNPIQHTKSGASPNSWKSRSPKIFTNDDKIWEDYCSTRL